MKQGFIKVAAAVPTVKVGDCQYNLNQIENLIALAEGKGVEIIVFPELCITGYTCQDLFRQNLLIDVAEQCVIRLLDFTRQLDIISIVGLPVVVGDLLLNCAVVIQKGQLLGIVPKTYLPNYSEFYEKRWFASAQDLRPTPIRFAGNSLTITPAPQLFRTCDGVVFGIEICEDVWAPIPPSNNLSIAGADIVFNLSASDELIGKHDYLKSLLSQQSARTITGYVYASSGFGESTQDVVYGGNAFIYENGKLLAEGKRFSMESQMILTQLDVEMLRSERRCNSTYVNAQRDLKTSLSTNPFLGGESTQLPIINCRSIEPRDFVLERGFDPLPFVPRPEELAAKCNDVFNIQQMGLAKRLTHTGAKNVVVGISGGLDSTLALLVCVGAFDKLNLERRGIVGVTMPGFGTTDRTYNNALQLMKGLGVTIREIPIRESVIQHFKDINHSIDNHDITYENSQARERTQILMDVSNQVGGFVVGTGDLSELALGWATYNGDHMSMYGVNASVPKTLIRHLVRYIAGNYSEEGNVRSILLDIVDTPISPELIPANEQGEIQQKTEDIVGPYELHDFFLYYFLRYGFSPAKIFLLAQKAFQSPDAARRNVSTYNDETIQHWLQVFIRRFFSQQFKRSCLPDGPKVGSVSLSPRGDWRMPSDASSNIWLTSLGC
ncbi:MAG: NAD(+) synthase [Prevotella sp.]|nr:NAD(+) synthase [Prevotella sp.]